MNKVLLVTGLFFMMITSTFNPILKTGEALCDENDCPPPPCGLFFEDCNIGDNLVHCSYDKKTTEGEGEWGGHAWGTLWKFNSIEEATSYFNDTYAERRTHLQGVIDSGWYEVTVFEDNPEQKLYYEAIQWGTIDPNISRTDYDAIFLSKTSVLHLHAAALNIFESQPKAACIYNELEQNFLELLGDEATELSVSIASPEQHFQGEKNREMKIIARVTDDTNKKVKGSTIGSVVASFTDHTRQIRADLNLYDDGAHYDGGNDDGTYGNKWTPDEIGDCVITVTAKKEGLTDGVAQVKGIVIAKPILKIPPKFSNNHPYKDEDGQDVPVFQRGTESPQFNITNITGTKPRGVELIVDINEPSSFGAPLHVKDLNIETPWETVPISVDWDWSSDYITTRNPTSIPVGKYTAKAKIRNSTTHQVLAESDEQEFYVIFNYPQQELYVTNSNAYAYKLDTGWCKGYALYQYNASIWKEALNKINGHSQVALACDKLRDLAHTIGGKGNNYPKWTIPKNWIYNWLPGLSQSCYWFNGGTLKFLKEGSGICMDYAALMTAYCRGVGIPSRTITGVATESNTKIYKHAWVETWDNGWYWHEPTYPQSFVNNRTRRTVSLGGTTGTDLYPLIGLEFRPDPTYYAAAPGPEGHPFACTATNVYDRYTFCADVTDFSFTNQPSGGYNYGQTLQFDITVKNTGAITITQPIRVRMFDISYAFMSNQLTQIGDAQFATKLTAGQAVSKSFSWTLPTHKHSNPYYGRSIGRDIKLVVYYTNVDGIRIYTDIFTKSIPGLSLRVAPQISVDDETILLTNATATSMDQAEGKIWKENMYILEQTATIQLYTEIEETENYSKAVVTLENTDSVEHTYAFSTLLAGKGDAVYVPGLGEITSDLTEPIAPVHYFITYSQANGTDDYISIHEFSKNATIENITMIDYEGVKGILVNVTWTQPLNPNSQQEFFIYFSRRLGDGQSFSDIQRAFADEIVSHGDSLATIGITTAESCKVGATFPINITIFNNGVISETMNIALNVSRVIDVMAYAIMELYNVSFNTTINSQTENIENFTIDVPESATSGEWDVFVTTDKEVSAKSTVVVEDAFDLTCPQNITVEQHSEFSFETTITNVWDATVHNVSAIIDLPYFLDTYDLIEQAIGDFLPNEKRKVQWQLNATSLGELPVDIFVVSDDGGYDMTSSIIISMQQIAMDDEQDENGSPGFDILLFVGAFAIIMVLLRRRK